MRISRPFLGAAAALLAAGSFAVGDVAAGPTTTPPTGAGCIDPTTAPTTVAPATTQPAVPTTLPVGAVPFTSPDGDFTVTFPGPPTDQTVPGAGAETAAWGYIDATRGFIVSRSTLAAGQTVDLRLGCEGAVSAMGATLVSSTAVTVDGRLGIELVASVDGGTAVQRIIDGGTAMYQLVVTQAGSFTADDPAVAAFFGSFHLTPSADTATTTPAATTTPGATTAPGVTAPTVTLPPLPSVPVATTAPAITTAPAGATPTTAPAAGAPTTVAPPPGWITFESPTDGYTVAFPSQPEVQTLSQPTGDGGTIPINQAFVDAGERAWSVNSFSLPPSGTFDIEAGRDGSLGDFSATLVSSVPIELAGRTGIEFVGSFTQDGRPASIVSRIYVGGNGVHQLIALTYESSDATDPQIAAFFGSFAFTGTASLRFPQAEFAAASAFASQESVR